MASRNFDATGTPRSIAAVLGLRDGQEYAGQNLSTTATLFVREALMIPSAGTRAHRHEAGSFFFFTPSGQTSLWAWTDDPAGCACIVTEAS